MNDPPSLVIAHRFWQLLCELSVDQRIEVEGTLTSVERGWSPLKHVYLNIHSYDWEAMLDPPHRMLVAVGLKGDRTYTLVIDLFQVRSSATPSPQGRLEAAQLCWNAWRP